MKKFTSLLISCSLALAGAAMAQKPDEQATPKNKAAEKTHAPEAKPGANAAKSQGRAMKPEGAATKQHETPNAPAAVNAQKVHATVEPAASAGTGDEDSQ